MGDLETPCISLPAGQFHISKGFVSLKKGLCKRKVLFLEGVDTLDPPLYSTEKRQKTQKINFFAQNFALDLTGIVVNSATKFLYGYYSIRPKFCPVFSTKNFQEMFWNVNRVMGRKVTHKKIAPMPPGLRTSVLFFCRQPIFSMAGLRPAHIHLQTVF